MLNFFSDYWVIILTVAVVALLFLHTDWQFRVLARRWAEMHGYSFLTLQSRWIRKGPFWLRSIHWNLVFRFRVRDSIGGERAGWLRCWSVGWWPKCNEVAVIWNENYDDSAKTVSDLPPLFTSAQLLGFLVGFVFFVVGMVGFHLPGIIHDPY